MIVLYKNNRSSGRRRVYLYVADITVNHRLGDLLSLSSSKCH